VLFGDTEAPNEGEVMLLKWRKKLFPTLSLGGKARLIFRWHWLWELIVTVMSSCVLLDKSVLLTVTLTIMGSS